MARPIYGTIIAYALHDGVGRIRLDDGEEVRFSLRALADLVPAIGVKVKVGALAPYPLGGQRALDISLAEDGKLYASRRAAYEKDLRNAMKIDSAGREVELVPAAPDAMMEMPAIGRAPAGTHAPPSAATAAAPRASLPRTTAPRGVAHTVRRTPKPAPAVAPAKAESRGKGRGARPR